MVVVKVRIRDHALTERILLVKVIRVDDLRRAIVNNERLISVEVMVAAAATAAATSSSAAATAATAAAATATAAAATAASSMTAVSFDFIGGVLFRIREAG